MFATFDVDLSGTIDVDELRALMAELCVPVSEQELAAAMEVIDKDNSGTIGFEEFHRWLKAEGQHGGDGGVLPLLRMKKVLRDMLGRNNEQQTQRVLLLRKKAEVRMW